jgi:hypothetical protein
MANEPHVSRNFGRLKNGNPPGDFTTAPRCGARTRAATPCKGPAIANGRCRFHGGPSTGPRTPEGLERSRKARWKHGRYSAKAIEDMRELRALLRHMRELLGRP